ncbi:pentatricopeptide repeat-containing protein At5g15280, mitochondrial [Mercurialis annua]|uniref:pentatricopeptide repeat-containing protein At5g15280, mitochondrial n=1 Tax=Mercurialis annua TaxID=3986 RepID=UPI0024AF60D6|nr:pentatricopeptide repeat-containing protein At5g15280, mitochondrial [Mercurialis annua]
MSRNHHCLNKNYYNSLLHYQSHAPLSLLPQQRKDPFQKDISDVVPHLTRPFSRILRLKPEDVLALLLGFQLQCGKVDVSSSKVESLWGIFKCVSDQDKGFKHLPKSCEVMGLVLIRYGMFREVQLLLLGMEKQGISLDNNEIYSKLIEGYVGASDLERAVLMYDRMREMNSAPSLLCYHVLIDLIVRMRRTRLAFRVCFDMVDSGSNLGDREIASVEKVVRLLCEDEMVQEARKVMRKVMALGFGSRGIFIDEIASGYCSKKDFEDLHSFLVEMKCSPNVLVGNKIINGFCRNYGVERADIFRLELEDLGFRSDEITFGILLGWCCFDGNLRSAFIYLSDVLSRGLKPSIWSYNALIGAMFREGMWKHARDVLDEVVNMGMTPNLSVFRTLVAGFCKVRQFEEVKMMVHEMVNCNLIESSSLENPLSEAFKVLGFSPLSIRLKRDNNVGFSKTEFYDSLGNGLYLDTDLDEYEERLNGILQGSVIPDFNLLISTECNEGNYKATLPLIDEMVQWGQELSVSILSALVKQLCASRSHIRASIHLIEKMPKLANQLDDDVLNLLVRAYCKSGLVYKGRLIFNQMLLRDARIENEIYTDLLGGLCKKGKLRDFHDCWDIARNRKWLPGLEDYKSLVDCLCNCRMPREALELFESMMVFHPHSRVEICHWYLEKLSITGFTSIAHKLVDELQYQGFFVDEISYNHILRGLCKEKNYTAAFTILEEMLARNWIPCLDVSLFLIPQYCSANRLDKAISLRDISLIKQPESEFSVNYALVRGFFQTGKVGEAASLVQDILLKGEFTNPEIYNNLLQGYCQANDLRIVRQLLSVLIRNFLSLSISNYENLVRLMCTHGSFTSALSLKALMLANNRYDSLIIYNILMFYLLSAGRSVHVIKVLDEIQEKGLLLNEVSYNFLIYGFSKCKDVASVQHYLSTMISKGYRSNNRSLRTAVTCLCDLGRLSDALELSREMEKRGWVHGSVVQNAIIEGLLSHNKLQEAEYFLDRMEEKDLIPNTINYDNLIKRFCFYGRLNKAVDLLNIMLRRGNLPNSASYDAVIHGLCLRNQLSEAMDFHSEMLHKDLKPSMKNCDMLVRKLCQFGQTGEAEKLLISMSQLGETPTKEMYSAVINRYRAENNSSKESELIRVMQQSGYEPDFDTHWSLISKLQHFKDKGIHKDDDNSNSSEGFLSRLLSASGFSDKKDSKFKMG